MTTNLNPHPDSADLSPHSIAERAFRHSRRWQLFLCICAGLSWLLLAASVIGIALFIVTFISPIQLHLAQEAARGRAIEPSQMQLLAETMFLSTRVLYNGSIAVAVLLIMSAGLTMLYIRASHRASLRQVREQLADISSQIRLLQQQIKD